ncbi:SURF1 family cytochrome oxidase biogenesis protein [Saccharopolyspora rosea]|uniref:SURF1-like protein n=1 Tax=Saccharopolyspora rosea TaxID=524884 RepID=A0ABW3G020_9PSEU|nr:SURF1 family cytochrome oxidase biogenesis protein [Saccharopolyspora rosea]
MRLKFLLRPGWIGLIVLVVVFSSLCFTLLAPWQFRRNEENQAQNDAIIQSFHAAPRPLADVLPGDKAPDQRTEWSRVTFRGHYLPQAEVLGWQRTVQGEPAFEVLTPFRLDDGTSLLVDRGYVRPVNGTRAPAYAPPPPGEVTLTARVRADEQDSKHRPLFEHDGHRWAYAVNSQTVGQGSGVALRPGYFALVDGQPGVLEPLPLPQLDSGPYFSYALQWIAFGVMAILAIIYFVVTEVRPREQEKAAEPPVAPDKPAETSAERPLPRRAGRRRRSVAAAIAEDERREREELEQRQ